MPTTSRSSMLGTLLLGAALILGGCTLPGNDDAPDDADAPTADGPDGTDTDDEASTETTDDEAAAAEDEETDGEVAPARRGTPQEPLPLGTVITLGEYEVSVTSVRPNATQLHLSANETNEPPAEDHQFVLLTVEGTYLGDRGGDPGFDLSWQFLGAAGETYDPLDSDDFCSLDTMLEVGELTTGATFTGKICISVPSDQVSGGELLLFETLATDPDPAYYALQ